MSQPAPARSDGKRRREDGGDPDVRIAAGGGDSSRPSDIQSLSHQLLRCRFHGIWAISDPRAQVSSTAESTIPRPTTMDRRIQVSWNE